MNTCTRCFSIALLALFLTGCGYETLYSNLDEQQTNEMLAILLSHGISAKKAGLDQNWSLQTARQDLPQAIALLKNEGYPRERYESLGDVFKKEGFVSSPMEERARLLHALSQELSNTLSTIDGVITARVHLAIPERRVLEETAAPSSASVFIKHRADSQVPNQTASIKALVVNSIEGLLYDNVTVTFFAATQPPTATAKQPRALKLAGLSPIALYGLAGLMVLAVVFSWFRRQPAGRKVLVRK